MKKFMMIGFIVSWFAGGYLLIVYRNICSIPLFINAAYFLLIYFLIVDKKVK